MVSKLNVLVICTSTRWLTFKIHFPISFLLAHHQEYGTAFSNVTKSYPRLQLFDWKKAAIPFSRVKQQQVLWAACHPPSLQGGPYPKQSLQWATTPGPHPKQPMGWSRGWNCSCPALARYPCPERGGLSHGTFLIRNVNSVRVCYSFHTHLMWS